MKDTIRNIVLGVAWTDDVDPHLESAVELARSLGATLHVVHAYRVPDAMFSPYPEIGAYAPEVMDAALEASGRRLAEQVERTAAGADVRARSVLGPADVALADVAEEVGAELIIVGATERGTVARRLLGTTAGRVIRTSPVPVLVSRHPGSGPHSRILMTTDLSEHSGVVYRRALNVIEALGAAAPVTVRTLFVVGVDLTVEEEALPGVLDGIRDHDLKEFLREVDPAGRTDESLVRMGDAATELVSEAERSDTDLLVLGTHGRGGISRFLIGSVAEAVARDAHCDVLVIPAAVPAGG